MNIEIREAILFNVSCLNHMTSVERVTDFRKRWEQLKMNLAPREHLVDRRAQEIKPHFINGNH